MTTGEPIIVCERLTRQFRMGEETVNALQDVSLTIGRGEFVSIMGPSGSGKSTLMNLIGALDTPTSGSITIGGTELRAASQTELAELRGRTIGFVFQQFHLLPRLTALENVAMPLIYRREPVTDGPERARRCLERVQLANRMNHLPSEMSGGQQQRVAIARALVNDPLLLLADEPTGALDSRTGAEIIALFQTLNAGGLTIVLVTHDERVAHAGNRIIRMRDGRVESDEANTDIWRPLAQDQEIRTS
ncbi:ABC transporter ATP-binding protein [Pedomonas sp. V897]|uniref:ABC transporter ATP-binding protein n=1 Tax=Pedomonas sp. V897 TaxID=3446482 RepID=UPI003EDEFDE8